MTTTLSYRLATAAMTAFVVLSMWSQTLSVPAATELAQTGHTVQAVQPELA